MEEEVAELKQVIKINLVNLECNKLIREDLRSV